MVTYLFLILKLTFIKYEKHYIHMTNCFLGKSIEKMKPGSWEQLWTVYVKVLFLYHKLHLVLFVTCSSYPLLPYNHSKFRSLKQQICLNSRFFCWQIWNVSQWRLIPASCAVAGGGERAEDFPAGDGTIWRLTTHTSRGDDGWERNGTLATAISQNTYMRSFMWLFGFLTP